MLPLYLFTKGTSVINTFDIKKELGNLVYFLTQEGNDSSTFYYTEDNKRVYAKNKKDILTLFRSSVKHYVAYDDYNDINGVILIWRGLAGHIERNYVKVVAKNKKITEDLLTVLLWNTDKELYVKLNKGSFLLDAFGKKGFRFFRGRGKEILLRRPQYVNNFDKRRDKGTKSDRRHISKQ